MLCDGNVNSFAALFLFFRLSAIIDERYVRFIEFEKEAPFTPGYGMHMRLSNRFLLRLAALALALVLSTSLLSACGSADKQDATDTTDTTALSDGTAEIAEDPFIYTEEDLTPYVTLGNYRGLTVTRASTTLTDEEFNDQVQMLREYYATPEKITNRAAAEGDTCNFDFSGYIDGVQFDGGTAAGQSITLSGNGGYIDGFVPAIIGKMPGESFDIVTTFPADYGVDNLTGKEAVFKCTLNYIEGELILPELNDEFAKTYYNFNSLDEMLAEFRVSLEHDREASAESQLYSDMWAQVVSNATIHQYPEEKVTYIYEQFVRDYTSYAMMGYGKTYEEYLTMVGMTDADIQQMARDQVKDDLVFYAVARAEGLAISDEDFAAELPAFAEMYGMSAENLVDQYGEDVIRDGMLWIKTQDLLFTYTTVLDAQ